ncbi:uncharacterized protein JN550_000386 [Neoarthrinium moseri]|uniref:uncharacterized protein n=1 Tax=Neoarthrinium moseri TaxID=1658444 RepID=UPI001FDE78F7|nr:uncharacterized protein JN550_000386 [Neoarthrinium moseri]KAI1878204.1 hypothetical protein JN550_000386 [Neoarthrinium moseri]
MNSKREKPAGGLLPLAGVWHKGCTLSTVNDSEQMFLCLLAWFDLGPLQSRADTAGEDAADEVKHSALGNGVETSPKAVHGIRILTRTPPELRLQLVAKTSSQKKRKIATSRRSPRETHSPDDPLPSLEVDDNPNFSFTSSTLEPSSPASGVPPRLLHAGTSALTSHPDYANSAASSPAGVADLSIQDQGGDSPTSSSLYVAKPSYHRTIMGGAADFPERASSPLKRRASSMDPEAEAEAGASEDVDMVTAPAPAPASEAAASDAVMEVSPSETAETQVDGAQGAMSPPESIEAHIKSIRTFCEEFEGRRLEDGDEAFIVSRKWVESVTGNGKNAKEAPDAASIRPVDNSDIIWEVLDDPSALSTTDLHKKKFVRLKPGIGPEHYNAFPPTAWELVMQWPGLAAGQIPIRRTAHATSDNEFDPNVQLELHPPVFTIHRLWSPNSPIPIKQIIKSQQPPPVRLARSRTCLWKNFLLHCKYHTNIDRTRKVRVWRIPRKLPTIGPSGSADASAAPTPPASPPASDPSNPQDSWPHLLLDVATFRELDDPADREKVEFRDVTVDDKYNGHMDLGKLALSTDQAIVLDEHIDGTDFVSNFSASKASQNLPVARASSTSLAVNRNNRSGRTSPAPSGPLTRGRAQKSGRQIGCVGLGNLGNTCYMNSALQCVRSVEELTKYFLSGEWEGEVNKDNVLAHNGDVAAAYAYLLRDIYKDPPPNSVTPKHFKSTLGRYAPAFSGYGQQDSQEFVGFLLDGLQEDLSRVKKKPYIEKPDSTDEMINDPEAIREMAEKVWDITKQRDDSVIADLFTGLYKSTLVCPDPNCAKVSITFDPFNSLSLPLPIENKWAHTIKFFPLNDKPVDIRVELNKSSSIKQLKEFISTRTAVPVERLHGAEEWKCKFYKQYPNGACASEEIGSSDNACFYEVEAVPTNWNSPESKKLEHAASKGRRSLLDEAEDPGAEVLDAMLVPVIHRATIKAGYGQPRQQFALVPHFIIVNPEESRDEDVIRRKILQKVATFTKHEVFARQEESDASDSTDFATAGSDSSNDGKVVAQSVEGEDDIVDVTMKDASETKSSQETSTQQAPAKYRFNDAVPAWVDSKEYLPADLQNLFELSYFSESGSLLANGMNAAHETTEYPKLSSRAPEPTASDDAGDSGTNGTASNDEDSSDEVPRRSSETPPTRMNAESEEEDGPPVVKIPHRPKNKPNTKPNNGQKKMKAHKKYGKKGSKRLQRQAAALSRKQQAHQDLLDARSPADTEDSGADGGPLIRLREGIVVDWVEDAFNALFDGEMGTFKDCQTLKDAELERAREARNRRKKHGISLENCLDEFEREEVLSENDTWYCPRCKQHQRASKKFDLWKTPDVLVVHLKRFSSSGWRRDKLEVLVDFPIEGLDLTERVLQKEDGKTEVYDLIGVDCHWGGLGGGHYTAHAKNFVDNQWYSYNDSSVSKANTDRIVDTSAYLLFYRRRSDVPLGGPRFKEIIDAYDNPASDEELTDAGEGRRLDEGSSPVGSSSAFPEGAGATRQRQVGTHGGRVHGSNGYETKSDDGVQRLIDPVRQSIEEDEGIDVTENPGNSNSVMGPTWSFDMIQNMNGDGAPGSPAASGAATDEAQHDSSGDEVFGPQDADTEMDNIPGVSHIELPAAPGPNPPPYEELPPPDYSGGFSRDEMTRVWDAKDGVHEVPAEGEQDQRSEEAAEIHLDDDGKKLA